MKSIDVKSLLIGILGTALVMVLMGMTPLSDGSTYVVAQCPNLEGPVTEGYRYHGLTTVDSNGHMLCKYLLVYNEYRTH